MRRLLSLTQALLLIHLRNKMTLFWNLLFPLFLLFTYALIFGQEGMGGAAYITWILPGVIVLNILSFGLLGSASTMVEMRERGVLRRLQATPMPAAGLMGAYLAVNLLLCLLQSFVLIAAAVLALGFRPGLSALVMVIPTILAATLLSISIGQVVSGMAVKAGVALALGVGFFAVATASASRLARAALALKPTEEAERHELRSAGIVLASAAMV